MKKPIIFLSYSIHLTILYYGSVRFLSDWLFCCLPTGLILASLFTGLIYYLRIPSPSKEDVEAILGKDFSEVMPGEIGNYVKIVAHRGAGLDAPENTLEAFKNCKENGCNFVELDVCLTADDVPVIFHDSSTGRLSEQDLEINKTTWADLQKLNLSDKHPHRDQFSKTRIPTLDEAVINLLAANQKIFIDVKYRDAKLVAVILDLFEKYPQLYSKALVTSFYATMIYMIRRRNPRIVGAIAWCPQVIYYASKESNESGRLLIKTLLHIFDIIHAWLLPRFTYFLTGFSVILLHRYCMNVKTVWEWKQRGIRVIAWTLNKPAEKRYCHDVLRIPYLTDKLNDAVDPHYQLDVPPNYLSY